MNVPEFPKKENVITKPIKFKSVSGNIRSTFIKMKKITLFDVGRIGCITEEHTGTFLRSLFQCPTYLWSVCRVIDDYSVLKIHYKTTHLPLTRWDLINPLDSRNSCSVSDCSFVKRWYSLRSSNFNYWQ